jgi:hypothetical protein
MANVIATLLTAPATINIVPASYKGPQRHAYKELKDLQAVHDPALASPYLAADAVETVAANGGTTGNFTLTLNFPKYSVAVTTANIAYNAAEAAIQSAIDTALSGQTLVSAYSAGHVDAGACANMASASCAITANGASVAKTNMVVTTANVDMDVAAPAVTRTTIGTGNRPAEAVLALYSAIVPSGSLPAAQGDTPAEGDYVVGDNPMSLSPGLQRLLVDEATASEDKAIGTALRNVPDCVG